MTLFIHAHIFDGESLHPDHSLLVEKGKIIDLIAGQYHPSSDEVINVNGDYLVPAFADLQIYGGNGELFAEHPSVASLTATYKYSLHGGGSHILPTIATHSYEKIFQAIDAVKEYWKLGLPGILGLHVEGPYINPLKRGAHVEAYIRRPVMEEVVTLMEKGKGVIKMMTIAPEVFDPEVLAYLRQQEIILSAGHSNATYDQAIAGFASGIPAATHLYNAMSPLQHRAPGLVGAIFNANETCCSIVADGFHVDFAAIAVAKKIMGPRLYYITDAVTENSTGVYTHHLQGEKYVVADGTLSGSALTMRKCVENGIRHVGIEKEESFRMASLYPWQLLGRSDQYGMIKKGYHAELAWLDQSFQLKGMYTQSRLTRF